MRFSKSEKSKPLKPSEEISDSEPVSVGSTESDSPSASESYIDTINNNTATVSI